MKKLVLIPSLAIASSLPALCAVSCGTVTSKWSLEDGEFKWTHGLAEGSVADNDAATDKYFNEIDNKLLADDMIKPEADVALEQKDFYIKCEIETVVNKIDKKEHRVSFKRYIEVETKPLDNKMYGLSKGWVTYENFPVKMFYEEESGVNSVNNWTLAQVEYDSPILLVGIPQSYKDDTKWSYSIDGVDAEGNTVKDTIKYNTDEDDSSHRFAILFCFGQPIVWYSWFFQNVSLSDK